MERKTTSDSGFSSAHDFSGDSRRVDVPISSDKISVSRRSAVRMRILACFASVAISVVVSSCGSNNNQFNAGKAAQSAAKSLGIHTGKIRDRSSPSTTLSGSVMATVSNCDVSAYKNPSNVANGTGSISASGTINNGQTTGGTFIVNVEWKGQTPAALTSQGYTDIDTTAQSQMITLKSGQAASWSASKGLFDVNFELGAGAVSEAPVQCVASVSAAG